MSFLHIPAYAAWLTGQVVISSTEVILDTFRPRQRQKPVVIGLPLRVTTDNEVVGLSASITMTPGTLVCGLRGMEDGGRLLLIHAMFGGDVDGVIDSLYDMEERMAPRVRDLPRPEAFVFDEYDPAVLVDEHTRLGTERETVEGLAGVPESVHLAPDPSEADVMPEKDIEAGEIVDADHGDAGRGDAGAAHGTAADTGKAHIKKEADNA